MVLILDTDFACPFSHPHYSPPNIPNDISHNQPILLNQPVLCVIGLQTAFVWVLLLCTAHFLRSQIVYCFALPSRFSSNQSTTKIRNCVYIFRHKQKFIPVFFQLAYQLWYIFLVFLGLLFHFSRAFRQQLLCAWQSKDRILRIYYEILRLAAWSSRQ